MSTFFSYNALVSQRSSGYKNTQFAVAEIVDNSIDADATKVKIIFVEKRDHQSRKYIDEIIIADNGSGMGKEALHSCLQFGATGNTDIEEIVSKKKKGKFGYGLPNASLSQCPNIHVYSWQEGMDIHEAYLDLKELKESHSIDIPPIKKVSMPGHYSTLGAVIDDHKGVLVSWRECDRLSNSRASTIIEKSEELIGCLFRYVIKDGVKIIFESYEFNQSQNKYNKTAGKTILPNDPLFLMADTVVSRKLLEESKKINGGADESTSPSTYFKKYSISANKCLPTSYVLQDFSYPFSFYWKGMKFDFEIKTSVADNDIQKPGIRDGGRTEIGKFYAKNKCISFVRAGREISSDNYGFYKETEFRNRWWGVEIMFNPDADDLLGVHNNKQGIEFTKTSEHDISERWDEKYSPLQKAREQLWNDLTSRIEKARKAAWKEVLKTHKEWEQKMTAEGGVESTFLPEGTATTTQTIMDVDGERPSFDEKQKTALLDRLKEKYGEINTSDIEKAIEKYDKTKIKGCVLYNKSESSALWSITNVFGFLIILINTNHSYYENILLPLKMKKQEMALAAVELFISSLAWEEDKHFSSGTEKDVIEQFRSYVGLHLDRYIKNINLEDMLSDEEKENDEE